MFGIPKVYLILAALVAALVIYFTGHHKGWVQRDLEMQAEISKKNEESRAKEQALNQQLNETSSKLLETNSVLDKKSTDLDRAIRAGRMRLPSSSCVQIAPSASATSGNPETGSKPSGPPDQAFDSDRATLAAIAEIVAQGDKNTAQLNACIDAYEAVRSQLNGNR